MSTLLDEARYLLRVAHERAERGPLRWQISRDALNQMADRERQWTYGERQAQTLMGLPYEINEQMIGESIILLRPIR
jgi:hypothetical protein